MKTRDWNGRQFPEKVTKAHRRADPPARPPLRSSGCPLTKVHIPSGNGNAVIFYLSAQTLNLLEKKKKKLLCLHCVFTMLFVRLQRFLGTPLSRDNVLASRRRVQRLGYCPSWAGRGSRTPSHFWIPLCSMLSLSRIAQR